MASSSSHAITPQREENFPEWYQQVIAAADLAENSEVRGSMVIKPWGYAIWELIQQQLDAKIKATGHRNAYFPLLIPLSHLEKEAQHVEGFAKECAVVTHHRLEVNSQGQLVPSGKLTEPYVIRPTSETIIGAAYARWVQSYRDLPILLNQWANVMRWEMRPRLFLRTAEFLWQEGHTAHETEAEAREETQKMLGVYEELAHKHLALPVLTGYKTESQRFPGAVETLCIEAMVQDRKAVQAGTSHFLGQNFAKASGIKFLGRDEKEHYAWTSSWGVSTRLIGTLIMAHSDDDGLVLPPRIAPAHVVLIPIIPKPAAQASVMEACTQLATSLRQERFHGEPLRVEIDSRDSGGGVKNWEWIKKGVPLRIEIGPRDLEKNSAMVAQRIDPPKEKKPYALATLASQVPSLLQNIQQHIYDKALAFRQTHTQKIETSSDFEAFFTPQNPHQPEIHGGLAWIHWGGDPAVEEKLQNELKVTIRCVPFTNPLGGELEPGTCPFTGKPSPQRVLFAKAY